MSYQYTQLKTAIGDIPKQFESILPKSTYPRRVARVVITRECSPSNPRMEFSPMWHFISVSLRNDWQFAETEHDGNANSRTEAIDKIYQHFGVTFNWDGDELSDESLAKLIRNAKRKGLIVGLDRDYYTGSFSSHGDMFDNHAYAYLSFDEARHEYSDSDEGNARQKALSYLDGELELYNQWINGDVWRYTSYDEHGEMIDSVCGYYGEEATDFEYIKKEAGVTSDTIVEIED